VRLTANPGSANEAFAPTNFAQATVIVDRGNASVLGEAGRGRTDVMIADGLELIGAWLGQAIAGSQRRRRFDRATGADK
jgi:hypothetical protein